MSLFIVRGALAAALVLAPVALPRAAEPSLAESRATLEKWVETRQLTSRIRSDWQNDRETLEQTIQMFERELKSIADQFTRVATNNVQVDIERQTARTEQAALGAGLDQARDAIARLEQQVLAIAPAFPPPLLEKLQPLIKRIPSDAPNTKASPVERMQTVVGILSEVDKFNGVVSVVSEIQKNPAGTEVQVETMYIGLGQAYFVDKTGDYAGVGTPTKEGWEWTPRKELAGPIQNSIAMYKNSLPAAFVGLPVQIK